MAKSKAKKTKKNVSNSETVVEQHGNNASVSVKKIDKKEGTEHFSLVKCTEVEESQNVGSNSNKTETAISDSVNVGVGSTQDANYSKRTSHNYSTSKGSNIKTDDDCPNTQSRGNSGNDRTHNFRPNMQNRNTDTSRNFDSNEKNILYKHTYNKKLQDNSVSDKNYSLDSSDHSSKTEKPLDDIESKEVGIHTSATKSKEGELNVHAEPFTPANLQNQNKSSKPSTPLEVDRSQIADESNKDEGTLNKSKTILISQGVVVNNQPLGEIMNLPKREVSQTTIRSQIARINDSNQNWDDPTRDQNDTLQRNIDSSNVVDETRCSTWTEENVSSSQIGNKEELNKTIWQNKKDAPKNKFEDKKIYGTRSITNKNRKSGPFPDQQRRYNNEGRDMGFREQKVTYRDKPKYSEGHEIRFPPRNNPKFTRLNKRLEKVDNEYQEFEKQTTKDEIVGIDTGFSQRTDSTFTTTGAPITGVYDCNQSWDDHTWDQKDSLRLKNIDNMNVVDETTRNMWEEEKVVSTQIEDKEELNETNLRNKKGESKKKFEEKNYETRSVTDKNRKSDSFVPYRQKRYDSEGRYTRHSGQEGSFRDKPRYSEGHDARFPPRTDPRITRLNKDIFDNRFEKVDKEYQEFEKQRRKDEIEFVRVTEKQQDLFQMPQEYSLAHCVAEDLRMGSGIAVTFKRDFKDIDILLNQKQKQGGLAILEREINMDKRYIYYLVTKRLSTGKPTYQNLWNSLKKMRDHINENKVKKIAIPRLGCGLDRLEWNVVKPMIEFLFKNVEVEIVVCNLQTDDSPSSPGLSKLSNKLVHVKKSVADIEPLTTIIYLATEEGDVLYEMDELSKKFNFLLKFKTAHKCEGDVVKYEDKQNSYILYGCIVKKSIKDSFDWSNFAKCISKINKNNKNDMYEYIGIQAIKDQEDDLINEKIITVLRYYLKYVDIYICWDGELVAQMPFSYQDK